MKVIAMIPARGGSKSVPNKNIKLLKDKPLVVWTVEDALGCKNIDSVYINTDDEAIASIATKAGAILPFTREAHLATDTSPTIDVLVDFWQKMKLKIPNTEAIVLLEPTAILRDTTALAKAIEMFIEQKPDSIVSLSPVPSQYNYKWQIQLDEKNNTLLLDNARLIDVIKRRQDLPKSYFRNGQFYIINPKNLETESPSIYGQNCLGYIIDNDKSIDINTQEDFDYAEYILTTANYKTRF